MTLTAATAEPTAGWVAQLELEFAYRNGKSVLTKRQQRGPLSVQRPFYPEGSTCHIYVLHPPGGVVGGDQLTINACADEQAEVLLTTPGATKFYRSQGHTACQQQNLTVSENCSMEFLPQENIYFPGAEVAVATRVNLSESARFIGWESHCFGLPANDEAFSSGQLKIDFSLYRQGKPLLLDRLLVTPKTMSMPAGLRGNPVVATLIATPADVDLLEQVRLRLDSDEQDFFAATLIDECLVIRYLGRSTAQCRATFADLWQLLRPTVVGREACLPRIWST